MGIVKYCHPHWSLNMSQQRRQFLRYLLGGGIGTLTIGFLMPRPSQSLEATTEEICNVKTYYPVFRLAIKITSL
jgi:hypothetical protein